MKTLTEQIAELDALPDPQSVVREVVPVRFGAPQRGVPIPTRKTSGIVAQLRALDVGMSIPIDNTEARKISPYTTYYGRKWGRKFRLSTLKPGHVRVWRVE